MARRSRDPRTRFAITRLKQAIASSLTEQLRDQPEAFGRLVELGLVDEGLLDDEEIDLTAAIQQFTSRIAELAATEPSVLQRLEVRPLEVMRGPDSLDGGGGVGVDRTIVFSDLEGFTSFTSARGDIEASALLRDHYDAVASVARARGGEVVKKIGDGHMLAFEYPEAAVLASLDLVDAAPDPLELRAGSHLGAVIRSDDDYFGNVVNIASRVADLAGGGTALTTAGVRSGIRDLGAVRFVDGPAERLPGIDEPVEILTIVRN